MSKIEIFCRVRNKLIKVDKKLGDALVKMKRASYNTKVETTYPNKMLISDVEPTLKVEVEKKKRGRKKKNVEELETDDLSIVEELETDDLFSSEADE